MTYTTASFLSLLTFSEKLRNFLTSDFDHKNKKIIYSSKCGTGRCIDCQNPLYNLQHTRGIGHSSDSQHEAIKF